MHLNVASTLTTAMALLSTASAAAVEIRAPEPMPAPVAAPAPNPVAAAAAAASSSGLPWSFVAHQERDCKDKLNVTYTGNGSTDCKFPGFFKFKSVMVTQWSGAHCVISFSNTYNASSPKVCPKILGQCPGNIPYQRCHNFDGDIPATWSTLCSNS